MLFCSGQIKKKQTGKKNTKASWEYIYVRIAGAAAFKGFRKGSLLTLFNDNHSAVTMGIKEETSIYVYSYSQAK